MSLDIVCVNCEEMLWCDLFFDTKRVCQNGFKTDK